MIKILNLIYSNLVSVSLIKVIDSYNFSYTKSYIETLICEIKCNNFCNTSNKIMLIVNIDIKDCSDDGSPICLYQCGGMLCGSCGK